MQSSTVWARNNLLQNNTPGKSSKYLETNVVRTFEVMHSENVFTNVRSSIISVLCTNHKKHEVVDRLNPAVSDLVRAMVYHRQPGSNVWTKALQTAV